MQANSKVTTIADRVQSSTALAAPEDRKSLIEVLGKSLYPGAAPDSIGMVLDYCGAAGLDPMQKPVHLVPMNVKVGEDEDGRPQYQKRDIVMPGVGLYRIQASRTRKYSGTDAPEFGPTKTMTFKKKVTAWENNKRSSKWVEASVEYPEWCRVTVYRVVEKQRCAFTALEYWVENYATSSRSSDAPNEMWQKRPFAQLAKCAEAQALRKAFPEVGAQPTAEEMEGKHDFDAQFEEVPADAAPKNNQPRSIDEPVAATVEVQAPAAEADQAQADQPAAETQNTASESPPAQGGQKKMIRLKAESLGVDLKAMCQQRGIAEDLSNLTVAGGNDLLKALREAGNQ